MDTLLTPVYGTHNHIMLCKVAYMYMQYFVGNQRQISGYQRGVGDHRVGQ